MFDRFEHILRVGSMQCLEYHGWVDLQFTAEAPAMPAALDATARRLSVPPDFVAFLRRWDGASLFVKRRRPGIRILSLAELHPAQSQGKDGGDNAGGLLGFAEIEDGYPLYLDLHSGSVLEADMGAERGRESILAPSFAVWLDRVVADAQTYLCWHWRPRSPEQVYYRLGLGSFLSGTAKTDTETWRRFLLDVYGVARPALKSIGIGVSREGPLSPDEAKLLESMRPHVMARETWGNSLGYWLWSPAHADLFSLLFEEPDSDHPVVFHSVALRGEGAASPREILYHHAWGTSGTLSLSQGERAELEHRGWKLGRAPAGTGSA